uniref:Lysine rich nucleolar protein 1 n=1 Tax=Ailuropoda melanoleuca TaxID=9646 RepID=A0A7N5KA14_AILME
MITKTHKGDLGLGVPEKKKKKKKKVVKEPETQYSVLNSDNYFTEICPTRALSPSKSVVLGQASEMPVLKKKKKKKGHSTLCEEHLEPETMLCAGRTEKLSSPRKQALGSSEFQGGEKKKKRKSLRPLAMPSGSRVKTSLDNRQGEEVTRVVKKPKKHKKEKAAQEAAAFSAKDPWFCEAGDTPSTCSVGKDGKEQAASGQKRKQGSPRECNVKVKKKKKIHQKGDTSLEGHLERSKSLESSPRKGSKKPVKVEAPEYIPIGHNPKSPAKKKMKSKKKVEPPGIEEPALKRNKKKKGKESRVAEEPWEEDPDTDLEVVLEKKGNMDEAHIDQVRRKALQEEIDRESGKTEASEPRKWTVSLMLRLWSVAYPSILTPSSPCTMRSRVMRDHVSPGPRGCPSLPAGSLHCRTCPELISFLLKGVLASLLESWPSKISSLNLCLLLWTGGVSHTLVTEGMRQARSSSGW